MNLLCNNLTSNSECRNRVFYWIVTALLVNGVPRGVIYGERLLVEKIYVYVGFRSEWRWVEVVKDRLYMKKRID